MLITSSIISDSTRYAFNAQNVYLFVLNGWLSDGLILAQVFIYVHCIVNLRSGSYKFNKCLAFPQRINSRSASDISLCSITISTGRWYDMSKQ